MFGKRTKTSRSTTPRWPLLALLPYLALNLAGQTLHTDAESAPTAPHSTRANLQAGLPGAPADDAACLICRWNDQSVGYLAALVAPQRALTLSQPTAHYLHSHDFTFEVHSQDRGPPQL